MEKSLKLVRSGDKTAKAEYAIMEKIKAQLEKNLPARSLDFTEEEMDFVKSLF